MYVAEILPAIRNIAPEWRRTVEQHALTFDATVPWLELFEQHVATATDAFCIGVKHQSDPTRTLLLPVTRRAVSLLGPLRVQALGSMSNYYTGLFGPIGSARSDAQAIDAMIGAIAHLPKSDTLDFYPLDQDAIETDALCSALDRNGYALERYFCFGNWYLNARGLRSPEYFQRLPGHVRSTLQRKGRKLLSMADTRIHIVTDSSAVHEAMDAYERVYRSSWKVDEPSKAFIRAFAAACADRGWLRLGLVEKASQPVAAQLWFVYRGTASIFKLAYDSRFSEFSAGSLLTKFMFQHALDVDQVDFVDYLCGDDPYKKDWMSERRVRIGVRAVRRNSISGVVDWARVRTKSLVSSIRRRPELNPTESL